MHKDVLCKKSDFFVSACSRRWVEGREKIVRLPAIPPETFELYVHWAYSHKVDVYEVMSDTDGGVTADDTPLSTSSHSSEDTRKKDPKRRYSRETLQLIQLYVAADMLLDRELKNRIIDTLTMRAEHGKLRMNDTCVSYAWAHTARGCGIRRCLVDVVCEISSSVFREWLKQKEAALPKEFFVDLIVRQLAQQQWQWGGDTPSYTHRCDYHEHASEEERAECPAFLANSLA